jgi:hypothetical protein
MSDVGDVITPERKAQLHLAAKGRGAHHQRDNKAATVGATIGARAAGRGRTAQEGADAATAAGEGCGVAGDGGEGASGAAKRKRDVVTVDSLLKGYMSNLSPLSAEDIPHCRTGSLRIM